MKNILFLLIAVFFWALNFYLGKITMEYVSPNASAFWRYLFAVATLLTLTYKKLPGWSVIRTQLKGVFLVGFIGLFGFIYFFFQGLKYTSEMNGALIISLNPATTLLLTVLFFDHRPNFRQVIGVVLSFLGVFYLLTGGQITTVRNISFNNGDLLFLIANVFFALNHIWVKKYASGLGNWNFTTLTSIICLLAFVPLIGFETSFPISSLPLTFWVASIGMGVFGTSLAYYCWNYGINKVGAPRGAIFLNALPLFSAIFAFGFGAEFYSYHVTSSLLIVSGLLLVQLKSLSIIELLPSNRKKFKQKHTYKNV